ncbi:hypothetical protein F5Y17DRAFT_458919 [Xylariaceae sp. FL0594]|nr:hypothetical protein F5Y17DRAFT_458919 [Xylariaceae sp. FL0594]
MAHPVSYDKDSRPTKVKIWEADKDVQKMAGKYATLEPYQYEQVPQYQYEDMNKYGSASGSGSGSGNGSGSGSGSKTVHDCISYNMYRYDYYQIFPVVFRGRRRDLPENRHVGLWCAPLRGDTHYFFHIEGRAGYFAYECRENYDPMDSGQFEVKCEAGTTSRAITSSELKRIMESVPIDNTSRSFNCQLWVGAALERLQQEGLLTEREVYNGIDNMAEGIMQARHGW